MCTRGEKLLLKQNNWNTNLQCWQNVLIGTVLFDKCINGRNNPMPAFRVRKVAHESLVDNCVIL